MVETITAVGMVISATPISEYDKRLVILTKEFGKITAFARGARKPTSPFLGGSQPMAFGEFTLYRGRNAYTVTAMKINEYFSNSMNDIDSMYMGMYFLEMADYYGRENIDGTETLKLIYLSLKALQNDSIPDTFGYSPFITSDLSSYIFLLNNSKIKAALLFVTVQSCLKIDSKNVALLLSGVRFSKLINSLIIEL